MSVKNYKDVRVWIDNAAATLTEVSDSLNSKTLTGTQENPEYQSFSDDEKNILPGVAGGSFTMNGFVDSTTDAIFGPLVGNRTSISKTIQEYNGVQYRYGEFYPTNVQFSGSTNDVQTFSADFTLTAALTSTSKSQA